MSAAGVYAIRQALINSAEPQNRWGVNPTNPNLADTFPEGLINVAGIGGTPSNPPPATDTTPPTCALAAPLAGSTVSGTVTVSASANDNVSVARVEISVDGQVRAD